ncbi:MAG: hypothetical protein RIQ73_462 [Actinomycetota bacterium]
MLSLLPNTPNTIAERILDAFPSGSYALVGLLRLLDIVETESIPTAAVECRVQPRMLINPEFVKTHSNSREAISTGDARVASCPARAYNTIPTHNACSEFRL